MALQEFVPGVPGSNLGEAIEITTIYYFQIKIDNDNTSVWLSGNNWYPIIGSSLVHGDLSQKESN